jgi:hypothetical protein
MADRLLDALAFESQFLDHLAPVWRELDGVRGDFRVGPDLVERARTKGIAGVRTPRPDHVPLMPPPSFGDSPALVAAYGDVKEGRRLGYGPFAFLEHGIGQTYGNFGAGSNGSYSGGADRADNTLVMVPGPDPAAAWRKAYPSARVEVVGSPRLDDLPRRFLDPTEASPVVAVSFHWPAPLSVSGYAGTAFGEYLPFLPELMKRFRTIGHAHPKGDWPAQVARQYRRMGLEFDPDFESVCRRADVYVCDNSSTIFEFAATGRPVVLLNAKHWTRKGPALGLRFWSASHVGLNVDDPRKLVETVELALEDPPEQRAARENALDLVYAYRTGAAARAAAAIQDWLA